MLFYYSAANDVTGNVLGTTSEEHEEGRKFSSPKKPLPPCIWKAAAKRIFWSIWNAAELLLLRALYLNSSKAFLSEFG